MQSLLRLVLSVMLLLSTAMFCRAGCSDCGCVNKRSGGKICKLVCEEKTISVVCYKGEDEQFCIPDPSCKQGKHCEPACESENSSCKGTGNGCGGKGCSGSGCGHCSGTTAKSGGWFVWFKWKPTTAQLATKKKLYTKTVKKKVPSYKWIVVDTCQCGACATAFKGKDTGYVRQVPPGLDAGQSIAVSDEEFHRLASSRPTANAK